MSTEKNILHTLEEGVMLTGLVAGVGWVGQKAFGESLSPNPSKSVISFVKTAANMTGCMLLRDWMKKNKYWPDILKMNREYKWAGGLYEKFAIAYITTACVVVIGFAGDKVFKTSLSPDPSSSVINFIKMAASVSASNMFLDYIDKKHIILMAASVAMMVAGAVLNATAFTGGGYLAKYLAGDSSAANLAEQRRHDIALEAHQKEVDAWQEKRQEYQDWLNQRYSEKMKADKNFENTDQAFTLYAKFHPQEINYLKHKPVFKYTPSEKHKNYELLYIGLGGLAIGAAAGYFI